MKFSFHKASNWGFCSEIEIRDLEELLKLVEKEDSIILSANEQSPKPCWNSFRKKIHEEKFDIKIYDDCIE